MITVSCYEGSKFRVFDFDLTRRLFVADDDEEWR